MESKGKKEDTAGPLIAVFLVLFLIVLGGFYFWNQRSEQAAETDELMYTTNMQETVDSIRTQSSSDSIDSIQSDLDHTSVENLDTIVNF